MKLQRLMASMGLASITLYIYGCNPHGAAQEAGLSIQYWWQGAVMLSGYLAAIAVFILHIYKIRIAREELRNILKEDPRVKIADVKEMADVIQSTKGRGIVYGPAWVVFLACLALGMEYTRSENTRLGEIVQTQQQVIRKKDLIIRDQDLKVKAHGQRLKNLQEELAIANSKATKMEREIRLARELVGILKSNVSVKKQNQLDGDIKRLLEKYPHLKGIYKQLQEMKTGAGREG